MGVTILLSDETLCEDEVDADISISIVKRFATAAQKDFEMLLITSKEKNKI